MELLSDVCTLCPCRLQYLTCFNKIIGLCPLEMLYITRVRTGRSWIGSQHLHALLQVRTAILWTAPLECALG